MSMTADAPLLTVRLKEVPWQRRSEPVVVGKEILELLSSSMYVDPMTIYREHVQNAADSIDDARTQRIIGTGESGTESITCDTMPRIIRIRTNGTGIQSRNFIKVELRGVVRHRSDHLLSPNAIENYLSQVAPVPFAGNFKFRDEIRAILEPHVHFADMHITINNGTCLVRRPHRNKIEISDSI